MGILYRQPLLLPRNIFLQTFMGILYKQPLLLPHKTPNSKLRSFISQANLPFYSLLRRIHKSPPRISSKTQSVSDRGKSSFSVQQENQALLFIANDAADREAELEFCTIPSACESDEEKGSPVVSDTIYERSGASAILSMANFSFEGFETFVRRSSTNCTSYLEDLLRETSMLGSGESLS